MFVLTRSYRALSVRDACGLCPAKHRSYSARLCFFRWYSLKICNVRQSVISSCVYEWDHFQVVEHINRMIVGYLKTWLTWSVLDLSGFQFWIFNEILNLRSHTRTYPLNTRIQDSYVYIKRWNIISSCEASRGSHRCAVRYQIIRLLFIDANFLEEAEIQQAIKVLVDAFEGSKRSIKPHW